MSKIKAVSFSENKVGKRIKASKKKLSWSLLIDEQEVKIDLYLSKISRKVKVAVNTEILHTGKQTKGTMFQFTHEFKGHQINLIQQGKIYDLRIDSVSFDFMLMQDKTKNEFTYDFKVPEVQIVEPVAIEPKKVTTNPFEDLFDEPKEEIKEQVYVENQPKKLKPFTIKPPPQQGQVRGVGVFQAPDIQPVKTQLAGDLFDNPSKPVSQQVRTVSPVPVSMPSFPQADNPFMTGNPFSNSPKTQQPNYYHTGYNYYK
ncbi:hypothetical protein SteCoe_25571 [Stentor coeruleus]|uniref:Uncharacterized protein n=1 Tax=Stentor coeruleus TaxID=5963 RepID=A0A1R2BEY1_9CILI|nr:hypothetical protein SteCoe_25571 [Stentor coeruleus]